MAVDPRFDPIRHPRGRGGLFRDTPDLLPSPPKPTLQPWQLDAPWRANHPGPESTTLFALRYAKLELVQEPLAPDERQRLDDYKDNGYAATNHSLRQQGLPAAALDIDQAIEKSTLREDITVFRGLGHSVEIPPEGSELIDRAFVSTSLSENVASLFGGGGGRKKDQPNAERVAEIHLPAGMHALAMSNALHRSDEAEILLPRNARFRVRQVRVDQWIRPGGAAVPVEHYVFDYVGQVEGPQLQMPLQEAKMRAPQRSRFAWYPGDFEVVTRLAESFTASARKNVEETMHDQRALSEYKQFGRGTDFFDPEKHPRDTIGRFAARLAFTREAQLPHGVSVTKGSGPNEYLVNNGRLSVFTGPDTQIVNGPTAAAVLALHYYSRNKRRGFLRRIAEREIGEAARTPHLHEPRSPFDAFEHPRGTGGEFRNKPDFKELGKKAQRTPKVQTTKPGQGPRVSGRQFREPHSPGVSASQQAGRDAYHAERQRIKAARRKKAGKPEPVGDIFTAINDAIAQVAARHAHA